MNSAPRTTAKAPRTPPLSGAFRKLWGAYAVSGLGDGIRVTALPLMAATLTGDPQEVALVATFERLPWLLFALIGGAAADRVDRRKLMIGIDVLRCLLVAGFIASALGGTLSPALLYAVAFLLGTTDTFYDTASQAMIPSTVPTPSLARANSRLFGTSVVNLSFAGPVIGAWLFAWNVHAPFAVDALTFLFSAVLLLRIPGSFRPAPPATPAPAGGWLGEIRAGLAFLLRHPVLRLLTVTVGLLSLAGAMATSVLVLYATRTLGLSEAGYGWLIAGSAVGSLVGSGLAARLGARLGWGTALTGAVLVAGVTLFLAGTVRSPYAVAALLAVNGGTVVVWNVLTAAKRQELVPDEQRGKAAGAYRLAAWGLMPVGSALGGFLAARTTVSAPMVTGGAVLLAASVLVLRLRAAERDASGGRADTDAADRS
ncbi:MFS transporter [Streptomyces sp. ISL-22]|uniref:MFS transporter n=1 Tax=unclassified Streptomyces TaxID=2593676 RepID=UPI001BE89A3F|nr:MULTISPECIES: MFS transporter [unclassified Streptomyces]MBT2417308.1 MFS transporter [Streptomyces sp. ISL-24]MBT2437917.1 MFS transporter [Streptomyces sp. ISL-22]